MPAKKSASGRSAANRKRSKPFALLPAWRKEFFHSVTLEEPLLRFVNAKLTPLNYREALIPFPAWRKDNIAWRLGGRANIERGGATVLQRQLRFALDAYLKDCREPAPDKFLINGRRPYQDAAAFVDPTGKAHTLHNDLQDLWYADLLKFLRRYGDGESYPAKLAKCASCSIYFLNAGGARQKTCGQRACRNSAYYQKRRRAVTVGN